MQGPGLRAGGRGGTPILRISRIAGLLRRTRRLQSPSWRRLGRSMHLDGAPPPSRRDGLFTAQERGLHVLRQLLRHRCMGAAFCRAIGRVEPGSRTLRDTPLRTPPVRHLIQVPSLQHDTTPRGCTARHRRLCGLTTRGPDRRCGP